MTLRTRDCVKRLVSQMAPCVVIEGKIQHRCLKLCRFDCMGVGVANVFARQTGISIYDGFCPDVLCQSPMRRACCKDETLNRGSICDEKSFASIRATVQRDN